MAKKQTLEHVARFSALRPNGVSRQQQACGPLRDVAAEGIKNQIDSADRFQGVVFEVDELLRAEVESRLTAGSAPGADDVRAGLTCELGCLCLIKTRPDSRNQQLGA